MARVIIRELGSRAPHVSVIIAKEEEIDKARVHEVNPASGQKFFYSMERFPGTMAATYRYFCENAKVEPKRAVEEELYVVGMQAFDVARYAGNIKPDALSTIRFLYEQKDVPMLMSKGDRRVQSNKFSALRARDNFLRASIVDNKTPRHFLQMINGYKGYVPYSVGNDYEKDIVPALEAGFTGVFIPAETWEVIGRMDEILAKVDRSRCLVLNNLGEIKERYGEL